MKERYAILMCGDAMGGSKDSLHYVSKEEALAYDDNGWAWAVKVTTERLKPKETQA